MRALAPDFAPYAWAASTAEVARIAGIDPSQVLRFDQNTPPLPLPSSRPGTIAGAVARVSSYPGSTYPPLIEAIARHAGVERENVVLGAGADDLILLCARAWAGPGDEIAIPQSPTYPLYRIAAQLAGATIADDAPVLTFACRPNNPTGALDDLPGARPLVVDEAYFEFAGETVLPLIEGGDVVVLRTFSKSFALAGARVGYALAHEDVAAELNARQSPAVLSSLSAELALAALRDPPDVGPVTAERERLAAAPRARHWKGYVSAVTTLRCGSGASRGDRCWGSASGCSSPSSTPRRTGVSMASACFRVGRSASVRVASRASVGPRCRRSGHCSTSRTRTPARHLRRQRGRRASSPRLGRARSSASSFTRRKAVPPARATSAVCSRRQHPFPPPDPVSGRRGWARRQGCALPRAARRR